MSSKYLKKIVVFLSVLSVTTSAQSLLGSKYPLGIPLQPRTGQAMGMAGTGVAVQNDFLVMASNPANLGIINRAVFSGALSFEIYNILSDDDVSRNLDLIPSLLSFSFPVGIFGAFGFSVDQRTELDAKWNQTQSVYSDMPATLELGLVQDGGATVWQAGWGYSFGSYGNLGIAYERMYFNDNYTAIRSIEGSAKDTLLDSTSTSYTGNGIRGGIQVPLKKLTLGLVGEYFFKSEDARYSHLLTGMGYDSLTKKDISFQPAPILNLGASYQFTQEWLIAADLAITFWDQFKSEAPIKQNVENTVGFSVGGQFIPAPNLLSPKYYEIINYRAGFRYSELPVSSASEFAITLGTGLPLQKGSGFFDIIFEYGRRWDRSYKDYTEEFAAIKLGINGGRKWYQKSAISY